MRRPWPTSLLAPDEGCARCRSVEHNPLWFPFGNRMESIWNRVMFALVEHATMAP